MELVACGPTGIDADGWRRILCSKHFAPINTQLSEAVASTAKRLCREKIDPLSIDTLPNCRLVALRKDTVAANGDPGVRPIGIGEVLRRIVGKTIA